LILTTNAYVHLTALQRAKIRTAAIAGSVVSFGFVVWVVLFVLWIRRRRQRLGQNTHPEQYVGDPMAERPPGRRRKLHIAPFGIALVSARRDQRRVEAAAESDVVPNDRREDGTSRDEALTERLRRIEVQLQTLLDMGLPEGAPPSYRS
jgi:flagellar biosynthesis/type III secretory pathway M-ring protein FliF/YscJ